MSNEFKCGYAAILGLPNAGKSTLMNNLLGQKISIVTRRPQTTRHRIIGVHTDQDSQIIFVDTPGLLNPAYKMQERLVSFIHKSVAEADVLLLIVDAANEKNNFELLSTAFNQSGKPVILLLNKIDLIDKQKLLSLISTCQNWFGFQAIIPISAQNNDGVQLVLNEIKKILPLHPALFPDDVLTEHTERFLTAELIREAIFDRYFDEIPYSCDVQIEEFKERENGMIFILAYIFVEKDSQKSIIIGKDGTMIRSLGIDARKKIEEFLNSKIYLELRVKVEPNWRRNEKSLQRFGYHQMTD
jgi:GTP-binding protein Era